MVSKITKRKICATLTAIAMLAGTATLLPEISGNSLNPITISADTNTVTYEVRFNREVVITGVSSDITGAVAIPSEIEGYPVVELENNLFKGMEGLTKIVIPSTVTKIGYNVFQDCTNLEEVEFSEGLEQIGAYSFQNCKSLKKIILPDSVTKIGNSAFDGCNAVTEIKLSPNIKTMGNYAFKSCFALESIDIPETIKSISNYCFQLCINLKEVNLHEGLTNISGKAFSGCGSLRVVKIPDSVTNIGIESFKNCGDVVNPIVLVGKEGGIAQRYVEEENDITLKFMTTEEYEATTTTTTEATTTEATLTEVTGVIRSMTKEDNGKYTVKYETSDIIGEIKNVPREKLYGLNTGDIVKITYNANNMTDITFEKIGVEETTTITTVTYHLIVKSVTKNDDYTYDFVFVDQKDRNKTYTMGKVPSFIIAAPDSLLEYGDTVDLVYDEQNNNVISIAKTGTTITETYPTETAMTTTTTEVTTTPEETTTTTEDTTATTPETTTTVEQDGEKGDINGDGKVNIVDLMTIAQHIASIKTIENDAEFDRADANSDGVVNIMDLMTVARVVAGIA